MNDLDLCLEVVSRSRQPLRHIRHWISWKPLEISQGSKGQSIGNGVWGIKWSRDRWRHVTPKGQTRDLNTLRAQYLKNDWMCYLATLAVCCSTVGYPSDGLASCVKEPENCSNCCPCLYSHRPLVLMCVSGFYRAMHFSAKRCVAIACRLSVRLSVSLVDCQHIGWNSSEIISRLVSLGCPLSADPNISGILQGGTPGNFSNGAIADPLRPPLPPKWGFHMLPRYANGHIPQHTWFDTSYLVLG